MKSSTGDIMDYKYTGMLKPFGVQAHYNKDVTANILSFHMLAAIKDAHMLYDNRVADCFRLIYKDGREIYFSNHGGGLYTFVDPKCNKVFRSIKFNDKKGEAKKNIQQSEVKDCKQCLQTVNESE